MGRPSESNRSKPEQSESFEERIEMLFDELAFALEWQRPSILFVPYGSEDMRDRAQRALGQRLADVGQKVIKYPVDEGHFDIPLLLSQHPERASSVFFISGLSKGGGKAGANAYRALNIRREYLVDFAIRVVFWLAKEEAIQLSQHAPDFWAFRHRVVEFNDIPQPEHHAVSVLDERSRDSQALPDGLENLGEQIRQHEIRLKNLEKREDSITGRLELLSTLSSLYLANGANEQSIQHFKKGIQIARQENNIAWMAKYWCDLGLVYLDLDQWNRAVRAIRKAIRLTPGDAGLWSALGHFYHVTKHLRDAIIAYRQAIQLDPKNPSALSSLVACYRLLGMADLAGEQIRLARPVMENETEYHRAAFESACGNADKAVELLAIALEKNQAGKKDVRDNPNFNFIRNDPRFEKVMGMERRPNRERASGKRPVHGK
jgi:tetratricopeptide (TPR) repeat protein